MKRNGPGHMVPGPCLGFDQAESRYVAAANREATSSQLTTFQNALM